MKNMRVWAFLLALMLLLAPMGSAQQQQFVDDDGREIFVDKPYERIISLYSAHTENLYVLGAGDALIGAHSTSTFPPEAAQLPQFDYNADPEYIIAANPDLVLIRPFISRRNPEFVEALELAGIDVVSMLPESLDALDDYIRNLAMLVGKEDQAELALVGFHAQIDAISKETAAFAPKTTVFFESTETELRTVTPDSMAGMAITLAGGINIAADAQPITEGSTIAAFGAERILQHADEIDIYVSQRGAMNAGGNAHAISIRPGFDTIKAVKEDRIYLINEKLISSPLLRYRIGVTEMARFLYPSEMDALDAYQNDAPATRRDLANVVVRAAHLPVFVPSSSSYYTQAHAGHVYGWFEDVPWTDEDFNFIETAVQTGFVDWTRADDDTQWFLPEEPVTRDQLAQTLFLMGDFESLDEHLVIGDLDQCAKPLIVQKLVDHGVFALTDGQFKPTRTVSCAQLVGAMGHLAP